MVRSVFPIKLFKLIFKLILTLLIIILILPIVLLALMYDYSNFKVEVDSQYQNITVEQMMSDSLDSFLNEETEHLEIGLSSEETNGLLIATFRANNPHYLTEDTTALDDDRKYAIYSEPLGYKGSLVDIKDNVLVLTSGADLKLGFITYRTTLKVTLGITATDEGYQLKVENLNIANLPVLPIYGFAKWSAQLFGVDIAAILEDAIPFGTFDAQNLIFDLSMDQISDLLMGNDGSDILKALLGFSMQKFGSQNQRLLDIYLNESSGGAFGVEFRLGLLKTLQTYQPLAHRITTNSELEALYQGQMANLLLSALTSDDGTLSLYLDELVVNQMVDYYLKDTMISEEEIIFNGKTYTLKTEPVSIEIKEQEIMHIKLFMSLKGSDTQTFNTLFDLKTKVELVGKDLVLTVENIGIGDEVSFDNENVALIMSLLGNNDIIVGNQIILKDFTESFVDEAIEIKEIYTQDAVLELVIEPNQDSALYQQISDLKNEIETALYMVASMPEFDAIADAIGNPLEPMTPEKQAEIIDAVNNLSPEEQAEFFTALEGVLTTDLSGLLP